VNKYKVEAQAHIYFLLKDIITDALKDMPVALRMEGDLKRKMANLHTMLEAWHTTFPCF